MNLPKLFFALSLALNAGLAFLLLLDTSTTSPEGRDQSARESSGDHRVAESVATTPSAPDDSAVLPASSGDKDPNMPAALDPTDYRATFEALQAAGFSRERAERILTTSAWVDTVEEVRALMNRSEDEYWRVDRGEAMSEMFGRMVRMRRERETELQEVLGADLQPDWMTSGMFGAGSSGLPPEKVRQMQMIEEDYGILEHELRMRTNGVLFPEDHQQLQMLEQEKRNDLAGLLTPEELEEFDLRNSSTSHSLRHQLRSFEPTEEEFRDVFALQREFDLEFAHSGGHPSDEESQRKRQEAEATMKEELRGLLGDERFAEYERSNDHSWQQLVAVTERLELDRARADEVFQMQELVQKQQAELNSNRDLSPEDQKEAKQMLWEETRRTVVEAIGEKGYDFYRNSGGWWLQQLEQQANQ